MSLSQAFQDIAKSVALALGDVAESVTYRKTTAVTYAPATSGTPSETVTSIAGVAAIWSGIDLERGASAEGRANVRDRTVILFGKDLGTTIPTEQGEIWRVAGDLFDYTGAGTTDDFSFEADPYNAIRGPNLGSIAVGQRLHIAQAAEEGNTGVATVAGVNNNLLVVDKALTTEDDSIARIRNVEVWRIVGVQADPAGATYTCQVRQ